MNSKKIYYILSSLVASAFFMSNIEGGSAETSSVSVHNYITILSGLCAVPLIRTKEFIYIAVTTIVVVLSTIVNAVDLSYWINLTYKILSFLPVVVLALRCSSNVIYQSSLIVFLSSTLIALVLLALGMDNARFILYPDIIPRFAGLVIEPGGYALGAIAIYFFRFLTELSPSRKFDVFSYVPLLVSGSSSVILRILADFLKLKIFTKILSFVFFLFAIYYIFESTRVGLSIWFRLNQYMEFLDNYPFYIFGGGVYMIEQARGVPGIVRIFVELGAVFSILLLIFLSITAARLIVKDCTFLIVGLMLPFVQEAYLTAFLWLLVLKIIVHSQSRIASNVVAANSK